VLKFLFALENSGSGFEIQGHIAGEVAFLTEGETGGLSEELPTPPLVDRDSVTRRARRWDVQSDVGELSFALRRVHSRGHGSRSEKQPLGQLTGGRRAPHPV